MQFFSNHRFLILLLCVFVQAIEDANNELPEKSTKKFYLSLDRVNFFEAFVHCKQGGMELASIENENDSAALDSFLDPYKIGNWSNGFWLSGTHLIDTFSFQYYWLSTGARTIFTNWLPNQPDNAQGLEHCMQWAYKSYNNATDQTGWNDWNCNATLRYVCEFISNLVE